MGLSLTLGLGLSQTGGAAFGPSVGMSNVTTQASATPSTVVATLGAGQNGLRIFTGETPASEKYFDLYVVKNGGAAVKVRMYRWQGRILQGAAGDTFALGTTDGRSVQIAAMTCPGSLAAPSGVTGTANCDQALPGLWSPSAAHVVLPTNGSKFQLNSDGTERWVFISEKSPSGTWSPPRWVVLPAAVNVVVHCNWTEIALANEAGATLSVTAPTSSTVGGAKAVMSLPMPTITGTSHVCTTGAQFATAIGAAVAGDEIVVSGSITLTGDVSRTSFTANEAAGRKGYEGILIRGVTAGDRTSGVVNSGGFGWTINQPGAGDIMALYGYMRDLTFDFGANAKQFSHGGGRYRHQNVRCTAGTIDLWDVNATNYIVVYDALFCRADTSADDCWNLSGAASFNADSRLRFYSCEGVAAGNNAASQCFTSHFGLAFEIYGGTWSDANTNVVANDAGTTKGYIFWATVSAGARLARMNNGLSIFGITWTGADLSTFDDARFCRVTGGVNFTPFRNSVGTIEHNLITTSGTGRGVFNSLGGSVIRGNIITACPEGIRIGNAAGAVASTDVMFNTISGCTTGWAQVDVSNMPVVHKNNAYRSSGTSVNIPTGGMPVITTNYNVLDPTVDADYTAGGNDTTGADAAVNATSFIPTASGNCDGNGDPTVVDYVGDADPYGFVHIFKSDRVSRGAREVPAIYSGAVLYPEYF